MKKLIFLVTVGIFALSSLVQAGIPDFIRTGEDMTYYEKVRYGLTGTLVGINGSGKDQYKAEEVVAFRKDGKVYERMPVIENNMETGKYAFMELMAFRNGMKLYRHDLSNGSNLPNQQEYLVFQDGRYIVRYDQNNSKTLNRFFQRSEESLATQ
jgi:hypothetical protein